MPLKFIKPLAGDQHENASFGLFSTWFIPSCSEVLLYVVQPAQFICDSIYFVVNNSSPYFVLIFYRPKVFLNVESLTVIQKTPHLCTRCLLPRKKTMPLTNYPGITHCGSHVSSVCATNTASRIHFIARLPRCCCSPSSRGCRESRLGTQCNFAFVIRHSGS